MSRPNDITSTEKLLDLIRKKRSDRGPLALKVKTPLPARKKTRLAFVSKLALQKSINVGVDIGHESLRLVKTKRNSHNSWDLIDYQIVPFESRIRRGSPEFGAFLKTALTRFCGSYEKISLWAIMSSANVRVCHILIPKVSKSQIDRAVFWMMKKESPFNEKESVLDFEVLKECVDEGTPKWSVMAYTAPIRDIEEIKDLFAKSGLPLTGVSIVPFATQNIFRTRWILTADATVAYLFIGNDFSRIDIYSEGNLIMTRGIKAGINSMVEALHQALVASDKTAPSTIDMHHARKVLFSLSPDSQPLEAGEPGYSLTEEEKYHLILPSLERLVRQVERTFEYYGNLIGQDKVNRIYITSAMRVYLPLIEHIGQQLDLQSEVLDLFDPELSGSARDDRNLTLSERVALAPALGIALSDNAYTPNLLVTFREKQEIKRIKSVNQGIFAALLILTMISAGFFLVEFAYVSSKQAAISRLQEQLARYQPRLTQNDVLQMAAKAKQQTLSARAYGERYLGMAVIGELSALTPPNIRLVNMKADLWVAAPEKPRELSKETPPTPAPAEKKEASGEAPKGQTPAAKSGNLMVEGIISGSRMSLESSLADYLIRLQASPLFRQVTLQKNGVERDKKRDILRFTISMKIAA